jgi:hypothetical protein
MLHLRTAPHFSLRSRFGGGGAGNFVALVRCPVTKGRIALPNLEHRMKSFIATAAIALGLAATFAPTPSQAGCLTGAAVGGVAGHMAGHHAVLGAAAGCAVGHHEASKAASQKAANAKAAQQQPPQSGS